MVKKCAMCGQPFDTEHPTVKLCSKDCVNKYNAILVKNQFIQRFCKECGKPFFTNEDKIFCSKECRQAVVDREKEKRLIKHNGYSSLDEKLRYCNKVGISYAEYQKRLTLNKMKEKGNNDEHEHN